MAQRKKILRTKAPAIEEPKYISTQIPPAAKKKTYAESTFLHEVVDNIEGSMQESVQAILADEEIKRNIQHFIQKDFRFFEGKKIKAETYTHAVQRTQRTLEALVLAETPEVREAFFTVRKEISKSRKQHVLDEATIAYIPLDRTPEAMEKLRKLVQLDRAEKKHARLEKFLRPEYFAQDQADNAPTHIGFQNYKTLVDCIDGFNPKTREDFDAVSDAMEDIQKQLALQYPDIHTPCEEMSNTIRTDYKKYMPEAMTESLKHFVEFSFLAGTTNDAEKIAHIFQADRKWNSGLIKLALSIQKATAQPIVTIAEHAGMLMSESGAFTTVEQEIRKAQGTGVRWEDIIPRVVADGNTASIPGLTRSFSEYGRIIGKKVAIDFRAALFQALYNGSFMAPAKRVAQRLANHLKHRTHMVIAEQFGTEEWIKQIDREAAIPETAVLEGYEHLKGRELFLYCLPATAGAGNMHVRMRVNQATRSELQATVAQRYGEDHRWRQTLEQTIETEVAAAINQRDKLPKSHYPLERSIGNLLGIAALVPDTDAYTEILSYGRSYDEINRQKFQNMAFVYLNHDGTVTGLKEAHGLASLDMETINEFLHDKYYRFQVKINKTDEKGELKEVYEEHTTFENFPDIIKHLREFSPKNTADLRFAGKTLKDLAEIVKKRAGNNPQTNQHITGTDLAKLVIDARKAWNIGHTEESRDLFINYVDKVCQRYWEDSKGVVMERVERIFSGHGANTNQLLGIIYATNAREGTDILDTAERVSKKFQGMSNETYAACAQEVSRAIQYAPPDQILGRVIGDKGFNANTYATFSTLTAYVDQNFPAQRMHELSISVDYKGKLFAAIYGDTFEGIPPETITEILKYHHETEIGYACGICSHTFQGRGISKDTLCPKCGMNKVCRTGNTIAVTVTERASVDEWINLVAREAKLAERIPVPKLAEMERYIHDALWRGREDLATISHIKLSQEKPNVLAYVINNGHLKEFIGLYKTLNLIGQERVLKGIGTFMEHTEKVMKVTHLASLEERNQRMRTFIDGLRGAASIDELLEKLAASQMNRFTDVTEADGRIVTQSDRGIYERIGSVFARTPMVITEDEGMTESCTVPVTLPRMLHLPEFVQSLGTSTANRDLVRLMIYLQAGLHRFGYYDTEADSKSIERKFAEFSNPEFAHALYSTLAYGCVIADIKGEFPRLAKQLDSTRSSVRQGYQATSLRDERTEPHENARLLIEKKAVFDLAQEDSALYTDLAQKLENVNHDTIMNKVAQIYTIINDKVGIPATRHQSSPRQTRTSATQRVRLREQTGAEYRGQPIFYYNEGTQVARVIEAHPQPLPNDRVQRIRERDAEECERVRALFDALKPQRVITESHVYDGEPDLDLYMDAMQDAKAGIVPEANIFRNRLVRERDIAVLISADIPQKLLIPVSKPADGKRIRLDFLRPALVHLADAVSIIGDDFAMMTYGSRGANEVFVNVIKDFDEPYNTNVEYRIGMMAPILHSRTGTAYRRFAESFGAVPAQRKIHIDMVSQLAADSDYKAPESHVLTAKGAAIERASGIELFGICADPSATPDMLADIYGHGRYVRVTDIQDVHTAALQMYRVLTLHD